MALPTKGRVIIDTTQGELDIELWSKECPRTCRNFIALAMEGYYDGVIFHRIVPGFLVQTGDRTGTGQGGESFYGDPFEDEIHPRLRFAHRGLVAMANKGTKDSNDSQFIITLDRADELHGKHTLFGRCVGDTVFNVLKIGEMEIDKNERPIYPPKIKTIRIIDNPFDDILPRITAAERRVQRKALEDAHREREEEARRRGAKKNVKLLSFAGDDAEEEDVAVPVKKKGIARPDLMDDTSHSNSIPDFVTAPPAKVEKEKEKVPETDKPEKAKASKSNDDDLAKIREKHAKEQAASGQTRKSEIEKMEENIRRGIKRSGDDSDDEGKKKKTKRSYLQEELAKYSKGLGLHSKKNKGKGREGAGGVRKDEGDVLAAMNSFRGKLQSSLVLGGDDAVDEEGDKPPQEGDALAGAADEEGMEIDDDRGFMTHSLHFPKDDGEESRKAERDYEVIDPRQRNARAKEEERERKKKAMKSKGGHRR